MAGVVAQLTTVALAAHPDAQEQQHLPARQTRLLRLGQTAVAARNLTIQLVMRMALTADVVRSMDIVAAHLNS